ncbi:hypothetical protein QQ045_002346 [Rhodiola kirilowii]
MLHKSKAHVEENRTELETYLKDATERINTEFDILGWWRMHSPRFPILSQMARDVLVVPISMVSSESAFSTSARIIDAFRRSLTPRLVQALICTQDWIRGRTRAYQSQFVLRKFLLRLKNLMKHFYHDRYILRDLELRPPWSPLPLQETSTREVEHIHARGVKRKASTRKASTREVGRGRGI